MKLFSSSSSPFVRKVMVAAHELGLSDRLDQAPAAAHPVNRDATVRAANPLGQIPTLVTDDGAILFDSRVICEYLDSIGNGSLFGQGAIRWRNLTQAATGDGLLGAALLTRYEQVARPAALRWDDWVTGQMGKVTDVLDQLERIAPELGDRVDIATITFACGIGYLDYRFPDYAWRREHPDTAGWFDRFSLRPSMTATLPSG